MYVLILLYMCNKDHHLFLISFYFINATMKIWQCCVFCYVMAVFFYFKIDGKHQSSTTIGCKTNDLYFNLSVIYM